MLSETDERFLQSTRGKILALLRRQESTVQELADAVGLTDNGVRAQLMALERDGFVRTTTSRPSARKPARVYALVPEAEQRLSVAYSPFLAELCGVLDRSLASADRDRTMREVGTRLAGDRRIPDGTNESRVRAAADEVERLGGSCDVVTTGSTLSIQGHGCPLSEVTRSHPEACLAVETMLSTMLGCEVHERCDRSNRPRCRFETNLVAT